MLALALDSANRTRLLEMSFIVERYHRAFDDELAQLRRWTSHARGDAGDIGGALDTLQGKLTLHTVFQEAELFPLFETGVACPPLVLEHWATDTLRLFGAMDHVRRACDSFDARAPLVARVRHLTNEVQDHLTAEANVLSAWAGFRM